MYGELRKVGCSMNGPSGMRYRAKTRRLGGDDGKNQTFQMIPGLQIVQL